jgi:hypothetical protein
MASEPHSDHDTDLEPIDLPDLGELPGGPVFEWLAEHGSRAEEQLLERRRRIALVLEQTQWIETMLRRVEGRIRDEIVRAGGQRFGHIHLHDRDSKLGRLYSLTPMAKGIGVLRRWYLTYTIRIPGKPQRTLPLLIDLHVGGRTLQLGLAPTEALATTGKDVPSIPLKRLHQFELEGIGIDDALGAMIIEANAWIEGVLLEKVRAAIKAFQDDVFRNGPPVTPKGDKSGSNSHSVPDWNQLIP